MIELIFAKVLSVIFEIYFLALFLRPLKMYPSNYTSTNQISIIGISKCCMLYCYITFFLGLIVNSYLLKAYN